MDTTKALPTLGGNDLLFQVADYTLATYNSWESPWTKATNQNSWVDYSGGGGYRSGLWYRKSGTTLQVSGMVANSTAGAVGSVIATLPVGFRPTFPVSTCVRTSGGVGFVHVDPGGLVTYLTGNPATPSFVNINIILPLT